MIGITDIGIGFITLFTNPILLLVIVLGVGAGATIGAIPGLTATMGIAVALPLTFGMPPEMGIILLVSIFVGGIYGGGIPAILIKTPGTPASAATIADGFYLAQQGQAPKALGVHVFSSVIGGLFATVILIFTSSIVARFALMFGSAEYFLLAIFGLSVISTVTGKSALKGLIAGVLGLLLSTVGFDPIGGFSRFMFGLFELGEGFNLVPALIGLFAVSQVLIEVEDVDVSIVKVKGITGKLPSLNEIKSIIPTIIRSSIMGTFIGAVPGPGAILGSFIPYSDAKRRSKNPETFGKGSIVGIAAAESGNNSAVKGALIPTFTLGIPGEAASAVLLGGLMILGLRPGPRLFVENLHVMRTLYAGIFIATIVMLGEGLLLSKYLGKIITLSKKILLPSILVLCMIGSYAIRNSVFDIGVCIAFGILGYIFVKLEFPLVPVLLGLILGPIGESHFRRALMISRGDFRIFISSWLSIALIVLTIFSLFFGIRMSRQIARMSADEQIKTKGDEEDE